METETRSLHFMVFPHGIIWRKGEVRRDHVRSCLTSPGAQTVRFEARLTSPKVWRKLIFLLILQSHPFGCCVGSAQRWQHSQQAHEVAQPARARSRQHLPVVGADGRHLDSPLGRNLLEAL